MTNIHKLKSKKKLISKSLGKLYTKKIKLMTQINNLEEAKLNNKIAITSKREKQKTIKHKK